DLTLSVSDLIYRHLGGWDVRRIRQVIAVEDVECILKTNIDLSKEDSLRWGFSNNGIYNSKSGYKLLQDLHELLLFELCQFNLVPLGCNSPLGCNYPATEIAVSVTRDERPQSYVSTNGPSWLASQLRVDAVNAGCLILSEEWSSHLS
ncbi:hypothetical protein HID58_060210, partial [Brassica napus]